MRMAIRRRTAGTTTHGARGGPRSLRCSCRETVAAARSFFSTLLEPNTRLRRLSLAADYDRACEMIVIYTHIGQRFRRVSKNGHADLNRYRRLPVKVKVCPFHPSDVPRKLPDLLVSRRHQHNPHGSERANSRRRPAKPTLSLLKSYLRQFARTSENECVLTAGGRGRHERGGVRSRENYRGAWNPRTPHRRRHPT